MNPIFSTGPSLPLRFTFAFVLSLLTMTFDIYTDSSKQLRGLLNTMVSPIQYLANLPQESFDALAKYAATKRSLLAENEALRQLQLIQNEKLQRYDMLKAENDKLRALLTTELRSEVRKHVAEIMSVASDPFSQDVLINKGSSNDVYEGQPVLDDLGVVGQVISVGNNTSRVILITDQTHALPIRVQRNDIRGILSGTGNINKMELLNLSHGTDIKVGDKLTTSGLGDVFPEGHPVAVVTEIYPDVSKPFMKVMAKPVAQLDRLKHVLLLWSDGQQQETAKESK